MLRLSSYMFGDLSITKVINLQWKAKFEALNVRGSIFISLFILVLEKT